MRRGIMAAHRTGRYFFRIEDRLHSLPIYFGISIANARLYCQIFALRRRFISPYTASLRLIVCVCGSIGIYDRPARTPLA